MTNLVNTIDSKLVADYGITEVFIHNGEVYITSNYDLGHELYTEIETKVLNNK